MNHKYKVWLELSRSDLKFNIAKIRKLLAPRTKLYAVVKSNAYGHGLLIFSQLANQLGVDGFCVDSIVEGYKLRTNKISKPIIVLGASLPATWSLAKKANLTITISSWPFLRLLAENYPQLPFHLKVDTGMHRQGFYLEELPKIKKYIDQRQLNLTGFYSHLAMPSNKKFSEQQLAAFQEVLKIFPDKKLVKHLAATGGALLGRKYHFDLVRVGMGLYGCREGFKPVLSWYTLVSEIKNLKSGDFIGYDLTEKIIKPKIAAVLPIGYWHGFDRGLSGIGEIEIKKKKARVLGRVSMDMIVVDISHINCKVGDKATILGSAIEMAKKIDTSPYEIVTRINPLIKKVVI